MGFSADAYRGADSPTKVPLSLFLSLFLVFNSIFMGVLLLICDCVVFAEVEDCVIFLKLANEKGGLCGLETSI